MDKDQRELLIVDDLSEETLTLLDSILDEESISEAKCKKEGDENPDVSSDKEFIEYARTVLKKAHGEKYDQEKADATAKGILDKADGDYSTAIGMLTNGLDESQETSISDLIQSTDGLDESFKEKAATIFEAAVSLKVHTIEDGLREKYENQLAEEVASIKTTLEEQVDNYLSYIAEAWMKENQVALESTMRAELAESFMTSLKNVFVEHYVDVPESKVDLLSTVEERALALSQEAEASKMEAARLAEELSVSRRELAILEASTDLADTQADKLKKLVEDIEYTDETTFREKIDTIKEFWFSSKKSERNVIAEETIVEDEDDSDSIIETIVEDDETSSEPKVSPEMKLYLEALKRVNRASMANKIPQ